MASNLRVDTILPSSGTNVAIGTASGTVSLVGNSNLTTTGNLTIGGNLGIGGTLTYEDVTNIDSVGVITARDGLRVTGITTITSGNIQINAGGNTTQAIFSGNGGSGARGLSIITESVGAQDEGVILNARASGTTGRIKLQTNSTTALTIDGSGSNGNITANTGNIIIGTAGKGIDYSAQSGAAAGMASELLDHYEEGTFSPTFGASNGTSTAAYSTQSGKYTRIGNIVHVQIRITLSSLSTNSHSHAWISGLPIASAERTATSSIVCGGMQNSGYNSFPIAGRTEAGATRIELFQATNGGVTDFSTSSVSGTAYFIVQCTYRAA